MASHSNGRHKQRSIYMSSQLKNKLMSIQDDETSFNTAIIEAVKFYYQEKAEEFAKKQRRLNAVAEELANSARKAEERRARDLQMLRNHKEN